MGPSEWSLKDWLWIGVMAAVFMAGAQTGRAIFDDDPPPAPNTRLCFEGADELTDKPTYGCIPAFLKEQPDATR